MSDRVLLIDDDADQAVVLSRMLRHQPGGLRIVTPQGHTPQALQAAIASDEPAVILLDHYLEEFTGDRLLRDLGTGPLPPVVVLTARDDGALVQGYLDLGVADFLAKDEITPSLLDRSLRFAIRQHRLQQELAKRQEVVLRREGLAMIGSLSLGLAERYHAINRTMLAGIQRLVPVDGDRSHAEGLTALLDAIDLCQRMTGMLEHLGGTDHDGPQVVDREVYGTLEVLQGPLRGLGVRTQSDLGLGVRRARMPAADLHQVVSQLVLNAAHALWQAVDPQIRVTTRYIGGACELIVEDHGIGMAPRDLARATEAFFTRKLHEDHRKPSIYPAHITGLGLGLTIARLAVERAGGGLTLTSTPGVGTRVVATLPTVV